MGAGRANCYRQNAGFELFYWNSAMKMVAGTAKYGYHS